MKIYHVCECCDRVFNITDSDDYQTRNDATHLTEATAEDIIMEESERGNIASGLCAECREEVYGSSLHDNFIYSHRYH